MRDIKIIQPVEDGGDWDLDIDIVDGEPIWLESNQSAGQRSALAAYTAKGSIPGMPDVGVQWSDYFQEQDTDGYISIDNQMKQAVQAYGISPDSSDLKESYTPFASINTDGSLSVQVFRTGV